VKAVAASAHSSASFGRRTRAAGSGIWNTKRSSRWRLKSFARIESEIAREWPAAAVAIHHRIGRLEIGDASVVIAAAASHRAEAFQACRYAIERIKQIAPIWKHEFFEDGEAWVEGATADVDDEAARQRARDIAACA
jgi:molybdopterin synthase catalytic subunit